MAATLTNGSRFVTANLCVNKVLNVREAVIVSIYTVSANSKLKKTTEKTGNPVLDREILPFSFSGQGSYISDLRREALTTFFCLRVV